MATVSAIDDTAAVPLSGATSLGAGATHGCAIVDRQVRCWGDNQYGQIGNGTRERALGATPVGGPLSNMLWLSRGHSSLHQCAIQGAGGAIFCWGRNGSGQLGDGTFVDSLVPLQVPWLDVALAVVTGGDHTCVLTLGGGVRCWGGGSYGQLGDGNQQFSATPVTPVGLASGVAEIAAGYRHTCARTTGGAVKCWGFNQFGQIGNGTVNAIATVPADVTGLAAGATAIGAGYQHSCAATASGVKCWGWNSGGQLGNGTQANASTPVDVSGLGGGVAQLALGQFHSCARTAGGAAYCWGANSFGSLGSGQPGGSSVPVAVAGLASGVAELVAGDSFNCARLADGTVRCWGEHSKGQLGMGADTRSFVPIDVAGLGAPMSVVSAGGGYTCAANAATVKCWGSNSSGEIGMAPESRVLAPTEVAGLPAAPIDVRAGDAHTCATVAGGALLCWGRNDLGQLGIGSTIPDSTPVPSPVVGLGSGVSGVAPGEFHTCAVANAGAKCWGQGSNGKLGDGTGASSAVPVAVSGLAAGVSTVAVGVNHSCALTSAGAVKCWGSNGEGELGNGGSAQSLVPVDVSELGAGVARIAAGYFHTCALSATGGVSCWGASNYGQLGNGSTTLSRVPVPVTGLASGVVAIAAGEYHSCALRAAGDVVCWGSNGSGRLGNGTDTPWRELAPVTVVGLTPVAVTHLAAGRSHTCVRNAAGAVQCWGEGIFGQLGNGGANSFPTPVPVVLESRCGTFTDVGADNAFCPNVQWLRNRGVTLGCVAGQYCPTAPVSRLAMAAFMNRLGNVLTPGVIEQEEATGPLDLATPTRVCTTDTLGAGAAPRTAVIDALVSATASSDVQLEVELAVSVDAGATWRTLLQVTQVPLGATVRAGRWQGIRTSASVPVDVGRTARFAIVVSHGGLPAGGQLDESSCHLRVRLDNRNPGAVPY